MQNVLDYLTGSVSASCASLVIYPLDVLKLQSIIDQPSTNLFSGLWIDLSGNFITQGFHFLFIQKFKRLIKQRSVIDRFKVVLLASFLTTFINGPIKTLQVNMVLH